jgi:hypothetical protein
MPRVTTIGPPNTVVPIFRDAAELAEANQAVEYVFGPNDNLAVIQADESDPVQVANFVESITLTVPLPPCKIRLPGPTTDPLNLPANGDYYGVADPNKRVFVDDDFNLTIDGGGYPLGAFGLQLSGELAADFFEDSGAIQFTFDDRAQQWVLGFLA